MAVVAFDYTAWSTRYPDLAVNCGPILAQQYFDEAGTLYLDNSDASIVPDVLRRGMLLNLLVAHLALLNSGSGGQGASDLVGRISNATEGSVSVTADLTGIPGSAAWFAQTRYGLQFWQATAYLRTMRYVPGLQPVFDPLWKGSGWH